MVTHMSTVTAKIWLTSEFNTIYIGSNIGDSLSSHAIVDNVIPDCSTINSKIHLNTISTVLKGLKCNYNLHIEGNRIRIRPENTRFYRTTTWCIAVHSVVGHKFIIADPSITGRIIEPRLLNCAI